MVKCSFLAKTGAEFRAASGPEERSAWMACHFSLKDRGLSNLPDTLPPDALLMVNDRLPLRDHDHGRIRDQLAEAAERLACRAVLLDLERPGCPETEALVRLLDGALPCPVAVSAAYGQGLRGPVFLPALPPDRPLGEYLAPWQGRELWLEAALGGETILLTAQGAAVKPLSSYEAPQASGFADTALHCHYRAETSPEEARFTLWRTEEDLAALLAEAEALGVTTTVGLYQELGGR